MNLTRNSQRKLMTVVSATGISMLFGFAYPFLFTPSQQQQLGGPSWHAHVNGIVIGLLIGLALSLGEIHLFQSRLQRLRFSLFLVLQTLYYVVTINVAVLSVMIAHGFFFHGIALHSESGTMIYESFIFSRDSLTINLYALAMVFSVSFIRQVNRMLGQNALINFLTGKYHRPIEEERVFMFLDLKDSTTIAEKLGHKGYHLFLDDFFYDITPSIIESKGEIYQYVGDEVVVTWRTEKGIRDGNCISCYFRAAAAIQRVSNRYEEKYGHIPTFKVGYHIGAVCAGLVGDIKRDIVFHGDTVNTASRIRSECTVLKRNLLLSGELLSKLSIQNYLTPESMGKIRLRGKEEEIELFAIQEAA